MKEGLTDNYIPFLVELEIARLVAITLVVVGFLLGMGKLTRRRKFILKDWWILWVGVLGYVIWLVVRDLYGLTPPCCVVF